MKALDPCERWMLKPPEEIIDRLLALSSRTIGLPVTAVPETRHRDRYSRYWMLVRRKQIREALRRAMRRAR